MTSKPSALRWPPAERINSTAPAGAARVTVRTRGGLQVPRVVSGLLLLGALTLVLAAAGAAVAGGPPEYLSGDIAVSAGSPQVWQNRTVVLSGNLTVEAGGSLTLVNSTLGLALTANGSYSVAVAPGGTLQVLDLDGSSSTAGDRSLVESAAAGRRFTVAFEPGSNVLVRASEVRDFGYNALIPGMTIGSSNVTFEGAWLGAYAFIKVDGASPRFTATTFDGGGQGSNYFYGSNAVLEDCTFTGHLVAVAALQGSALVVDGTLLRDLAFALAVNGSSVQASNTTLLNTSQGFYLTNASSVVATDVDLGGAPVNFGDNASLLESYRSFSVLVLNQALEPVRSATVEFRAAGGVPVYAGVTGDQGSFGPVPLLGYNETASGKLTAANYTLNATRGLNTTEVAFSALTESNQLTVSLNANLDPTLTLLRPAPGSDLLAGVPATFEVAAVDPDATAGGLTVEWREATLGLLGTGSIATIALPLGNWTVTVEVSDTDGGFRALPFQLRSVGPTVETFTDGGQPPTVRFEVSKTARGAFLVGPSFGSQPPALAVGPAWEVRPATGTVVWSNGTLTVAYDPASLPYGVNPSLLAVARHNGTAWAVVPGSVHDAASSTVRVAVTPATGLGSFVVVALAPAGVAPNITVPPRLVAVRGVPFAYSAVAHDTPGQVLSYALEGAPAWVQVEAASGLISGTAGSQDRGVVNFTLAVTDDTNLTARVPVEVYVTASAENTPPRLVNAAVVPANPRAGSEVTVQVTYFDAEDDPPVVLELLVDGDPYLMEPLDPRDIFVDDGKSYVARVTLGAGAHDLSFRTTDGGPGHADVVLSGLQVEATVGALDAVNNVFLALFVSAALTLALIVYLSKGRADPRAGRKGAPPEPEDRVDFLEGASLGRIEPQPPGKPTGGPKGRQDDLEATADDAGAKVAEIADEVDQQLSGGERR